MAPSGALTTNAPPRPEIPSAAKSKSALAGPHAWRWATTVAIALIYATAIGDWLKGPQEVLVCVGLLYAVPVVAVIWITAGEGATL